jgi:exodeoxyribonuclease V alpha subunit
VIFENEAKAFYIFRMVLDAECVTPTIAAQGNIVTVRGDVPGIKVAVGTWFGFEGLWDEHPQHGLQIKVTRAPVIKSDWDADTAEKILLSQGVGGSLVSSLKTHFGKDMAQALLDPEKIQEAPGMTKFTALHIHQKWQIARAHFLTLDFLGDLGLPQGRVRQVWSVFGDQAREVLSVNPWALVQIEGISFEDADTVAVRLNLDCSSSNPSRVEGAVLYASRAGRGFGHLYSSASDILSAVRSVDPLISDKDVASALKSLQEKNLLVLDRTTSPGVTAIYDPWSYKIEVDSAQALVERATNAKIGPEASKRYVKALVGEESPMGLREAVVETLGKIGSSGGISLSTKQAEGVINALTEPISVITGLPGTGKTTCLRMAVLLLQEAGVNFLIVAPTGIAAKRVSSVTGSQASTIHRAFKAKGESDQGREATYAGVVGESESGLSSDGSDEVWGFGPGNPHPAEVVILDESSMVDQHILFRVLTCTRPDTRLVFVGDSAQLPSVGPGNVLRDILASGNYATVRLTEIFRQAETSPIIKAAHDIHAGRVPPAPVGTDFSLVPVGEEEEVAGLLVSLAIKLFQRRLNFQVLSPRHHGVVGVTSLNTRLREVLNPKQPSLQEVKLGSEVLREEDRIMVVKNDYKLGVFNGDVGKVSSIDKRSKEIEIKIHGPPVLHIRIPFKTAPTLLRLAYAVTVHKCQGLEYDVILMPLVGSFGAQLQRNLFYTAVTRAKKKVVLVGHPSAMERAIANDREGTRNTLFLRRLLSNTPQNP